MRVHTKRRFQSLRTGAVARAAGFALALLCAGACQRAPEARNVVVVCMDTVRFDTFWLTETAGLNDEFSPWAERALRFNRVLAPSPWTVPSVASLLTGRYPAAHGAGFGLDEIAELGERLPAPLPSSIPTLGEILAARGYRTGGFVASPWFAKDVGVARAGIEVHRGAPGKRIVALAGDWLEEGAEDERPFFLYLHSVDAHMRRLLQGERLLRRRVRAMPPERRAAAIAAAPAGICNGTDARLCLVHLAYVEDVARVRASLAQLLGDLERRGLLETTIVVLYSDHGEEFSDHEEPQRQRGTGPGRAQGRYGLGHGHAMYQELLHVPLLVWHPSRAGVDVEVGASLVDVVPTLLAWMAEPPAESAMDGISLAEASQERPRFASGMAHGPPESVVVRGRWKLIHRRMPEERVLFDLAADPLEQTPLDEPTLAAELDALLADYAATAPSDPSDRAPVPQLSREEFEALQALGYLEDAELP